MWDDDYIDTDGRLTVEGMERVIAEIDLGIPASRSKLPDHQAAQTVPARRLGLPDAMPDLAPIAVPDRPLRGG